MLHPIWFPIPAEKVVPEVTDKTRMLAEQIPGRHGRTYIFDDEASYYEGYQTAWFALTKKKAGWDCMRHYEILASGCIPVFANLGECPPNTLTALPKGLLQEANALYGQLGKKAFEELTAAEHAECRSLARRLLSHTQTTLTTEHLARYMLDSVPGPSQEVLVISGSARPDYLRCLALHGLKKVLGSACHDYPKIEHIYKSEQSYTHLYGKGFTYTNLLDSSLHDKERNRSVPDDIKAHRYDKIIYGSLHRGLPLLDLVQQHYAPADVVFVCGEDPNCHRRGCDAASHQHWVDKGHHVFVRELP